MINHPRRSRAKRSIAIDLTHNHASDYASLLSAVRDSFDGAAGLPLFSTSAGEGLFGVFLAHIGDERQVHTCSTCRRFVEGFGGLVAVAEHGASDPVMWRQEMVPAFYKPAVKAMREAVSHSRITAPFLSNEKTWGQPTTGTWTHFSVANPRIHKDRLLTPGQAMAAKREDFKTVASALADFTPEMLDAALRLLEAETLPMSERFIGPVKWLKELHERRSLARGVARDNILWRAIATAPDGYCHPRSSMVGSLLEDLGAGMSFEAVRAAFAAKVHPLRYQRPVAPPSIGNIKRAEEIVAKLGIAPALDRRFATLDECETMWTPSAPSDAPRNGVFGHLRTKQNAPTVSVDMPRITVTWEKFTRMVLPTANAIDAMVPAGGRAPLLALTTAVNADAPPILKWDSEDHRNAVAWYIYPNGSPPSQWGLRSGEWRKVTAIVPLPTLWGARPQTFLGEGVVLTLDGCMDSVTTSGNALFPSCLKDDLHEVRSTIESYSRRAQIQGRDTGSACGLDVRKGQQINCVVRVRSGGTWTPYLIDRWD